VSPTARQTVARLLVVLASIAIVLALVAGYARRAAVDSDQFANRATTALHNDSVRTLVAEKITDDVVLKRQADLLSARPIIESVASSIVGSAAFTNLFRAAVRDVHSALFNRNQHTVTLALKDVGTVLSEALRKLKPDVARKVDSNGELTLVHEDVGSLTATLVRVAHTVRLLAVLLLVLVLLLAGGAVLVSPDRRRTFVELGVGAAVGAVVLLVAYGVLRSLAIHHVESPEDQAAVGAVWDAFLGDLRTAAWIVAGAGAVIAAAAASLIRPIDVGEPLRQAAAWLSREPGRPALKVARGVILVALGLIVVIQRDAVLQLVLTVAGVYLIYEGVSALLQLIYKPPPPELAEQRAHDRAARRRIIAVTAVAALLIVGAAGAFVGTGGTTTAPPLGGGCNGHEELCGRPLDEVALPATHNAMSVPLPGWFSSEQERPIIDQLNDGIRGLLIDTHYGDLLGNGKVRTFFGSEEELRKQAQQDGVSPDAVDAAQRTRGRLGFSGKGKRGMYLCHTFCELGATRLDSVLNHIHDFLVANPNEVLVVINQDYLTPQDFVGAVKAAGLEDFVYRGPVTGHWDTLRQMIDSDQRIVFLAENHAGAAPWYHLAYQSITEETPFKFTKVAQLTDPAKLPASCKANRGPKSGAPMFLVNHWISTDPFPRPSDAAKVNAYKPLLARMRDCERIRKHVPNLVAINFYKKGDVFRVVDTLNGVGAG
jgi:hypothetical protein